MMKRLHELLFRLRALFRRERLDAEMREEMEQHLEMAARERVEAGAARADAEYAARRAFGGVEQIKERARDQRGFVWLEQLWQDVRHGARALRKAPAFSGVSILTLALGIAATTTVFSVARGTLLRPLPWMESERLVMLWEDKPQGGAHELVTGGRLVEWREHTHLFSSLAYWPAWPGAHDFKLSTADGLAPIRGAFASADLFPLLGVTPVLGRGFKADEDNREAAPTAILSYGLWQRRFGGSADVLWRTVTVDTFRRESYQVVGVMPPRFDFPGGAEIWLPTGWMGVAVEPGGNGHWFQVLARLAPGITIERVRTELNARSSSNGVQVSVIPLLEQTIGPDTRRALLVLCGAVGCLLLIACANVSNLLLARGTSRTKEIGMRLALGASRGRIARQLVLETLLLAGVAGVLGILVSWWLVDLLLAFNAGTLPRAHEVTVDRVVLGFAIALSLVTGLIASLVPLRQVASTDLNEMLKASGGSRSGTPQLRRLRAALVVGEIALTVILLAGATLMAKSFVRLDREGAGFQPENLLLAQIDLTSLPDNEATFLDTLLERVRQYPGVSNAGAATKLSVAQPPQQFFSFAIQGRDDAPFTGDMLSCTPDYFATLRVPLIRGRSFDERDRRDTSKVALINETAARRFRGVDPIGQRITFLRRDGQPDPDWREIVGIVADLKNSGLEAATLPEIYVPRTQWSWTHAALVIRSTTGGGAIADALRHDIRSLSSNVPLPQLGPTSQAIEQWKGPPRFRTMLMTSFGLLALALMLLGIYSVMSYTVARRTAEIGVRMAMGAQARDIHRLVLGNGLKMAVGGIVAGLLCALALGRVLASLLYTVRTTDAVVFLWVPLLIFFVTTLACWLPARRASRIDPLTALRSE